MLFYVPHHCQHRHSTTAEHFFKCYRMYSRNTCFMVILRINRSPLWVMVSIAIAGNVLSLVGAPIHDLFKMPPLDSPVCVCLRCAHYLHSASDCNLAKYRERIDYWCCYHLLLLPLLLQQRRENVARTRSLRNRTNLRAPDKRRYYCFRSVYSRATVEITPHSGDLGDRTLQKLPLSYLLFLDFFLPPIGRSCPDRPSIYLDIHTNNIHGSL